MIKVTTEYIAAGGNRQPSAADWVEDVIAYGADNNVAIWSPADQNVVGIRSLSAGHTDVVNAVKFFVPPSIGQSSRIVLSGSVDSTIRVWKLDDQHESLTSLETIQAHSSSVNCLAVLPESNIFASGSADATVKIWRLTHDLDGVVVRLLQTLELSPRSFPLTLSLHELSHDGDIILAVAGTKNSVQIYTGIADGNFSQQANLVGHEAWIRSLSIITESGSRGSDLLLASGSQDKYIRLWRIAKQVERDQGQLDNGDGNPDIFRASLSNKRYHLHGKKTTYLLTFEALLLGHDDWIYTLAWQHQPGQKLRLLSTSADNSVAVWEADPGSGLWLCTTRLGEISAQKGSTTATGSTGGFWIGLWSATGDTIVSIGKSGGWRVWKLNDTSQRWMSGVGVGGHTRPVNDIAWSKNGDYLLSTGADQTTRMHAEWRRPGKHSWHEMARPQIHGYDLNCIDTCGLTRLISGAEEKLLRVFDEPRSCADLLSQICDIQVPDEDKLPDSANIPVLGLSNKMVERAEQPDLDVEDDDSNAILSPPNAPVVRLVPPSEDELARDTLWPECEKLYGHGYEISALAASYDGTLVATSCKASSTEHAVIRLFTTKDWREVKPSLTAHSLTCTALAFSPDDRYLLSVGRDRQLAIFERGSDKSAPELYIAKVVMPKAHARMILGACWAPLGAGYVFATGGRDKTVRIWKLAGQAADCIATITVASGVTAVDFLPVMYQDSLLLAVGTETGAVSFHEHHPSTALVTTVHELEKMSTPSKAVTALKWRPMTSMQEGAKNIGQIAVASEDTSIRVFQVVS